MLMNNTLINILYDKYLIWIWPAMITPDLKKYRIGHESESSTKNSTSHCLNGKSLSNNIMDS